MLAAHRIHGCAGEVFENSMWICRHHFPPSGHESLPLIYAHTQHSCKRVHSKPVCKVKKQHSVASNEACLVLPVVKAYQYLHIHNTRNETPNFWKQHERKQSVSGFIYRRTPECELCMLTSPRFCATTHPCMPGRNALDSKSNSHTSKNTCLKKIYEKIRTSYANRCQDLDMLLIRHNVRPAACVSTNVQLLSSQFFV